MRDFTNEMLDASAAKRKILASEFSWSLFRHELFEKCRRAYFIRYYLAQGGWDAFSNMAAREAYFTKYLMPLDQWIARTIQDSIVGAIRKVSAASGAKRKSRDFNFYLLRFISKATADLEYSLKTKEYRYDAKLPAILEHHLGIGDFADHIKICRAAVDALSCAYAFLIRSELIREIAAMDILDLRTDEKFLRIDYKGFPIWLAPGLVFFRNGTVCAFDCLARKSMENEDMDAHMDRIALMGSIFALYRDQRHPTYPAFYSVCTLYDRTAALLMNLYGEDPRPMIDESSSKMLCLIRYDGSVDPDHFPCAEDKSACELCQYQTACRLMQKG